jgi:DNA-binding NtrC family response regulator
MATRAELDPAEREVFSLLARASFANPFGEERAAIDLKIAGVAGPVPREERLRLLLPRLEECLRRLEASGRADVRAFRGPDREMVETVFLFDAYYRISDALDDLIRRQLEHGDEPCPVPFATECASLLRRRGLSAAEAWRHFALLYQLRRAYYFIGRELVGRSPCMRQLRRQLWNAVVTHDIRSYALFLIDRMEEFSTLILGETGTGKGTAAAAIGRSAFIPFDEKKGRFVESFTRAFVSINLSQFPEALIESELFGHRKGAFTGAVEDHDGILSLCSSHGAVFLDEIGEVSGPAQIKLLRVLQERVFSPVGSHEKLRFRGRILAATNRSLAELRAPGRLRDDFFYRLCSATIEVPPLRQRLAEDPLELDEYLRHTLRRLTGADSPDLLSRVRGAIERSLPRDYAWPGNVRELEQCLRSILLTDDYGGDGRAAATSLEARITADIAAGTVDARGLLVAYSALLHERYGTYNEVARRTKLDRRTVKKYVDEARRAEKRKDT